MRCILIIMSKAIDYYRFTLDNDKKVSVYTAEINLLFHLFHGVTQS